MLDKIEKQFLWDWMDDVGRYQLPDLADFRPMWEEAQKLNIDNYSDYLKYKEDPIRFSLKPKVSFTDYVKSLPPKEDSKPGEVINPKFSTPKKSQKDTVTEAINNNNERISPNVRAFIQEEKDLIENEQWEEMIKMFSIHPFFHNPDIRELYSLLEKAGIIIPDEIKEKALINKCNELVAKLRGNQRYQYILKRLTKEGQLDIIEALDVFFEHTFGFTKVEMVDTFNKYKNDLIIPIQELYLD